MWQRSRLAVLATLVCAALASASAGCRSDAGGGDESANAAALVATLAPDLQRCDETAAKAAAALRQAIEFHGERDNARLPLTDTMRYRRAFESGRAAVAALDGALRCAGGLRLRLLVDSKVQKVSQSALAGVAAARPYLPRGEDATLPKSQRFASDAYKLMLDVVEYFYDFLTKSGPNGERRAPSGIRLAELSTRLSLLVARAGELGLADSPVAASLAQLAGDVAALVKANQPTLQSIERTGRVVGLVANDYMGYWNDHAREIIAAIAETYTVAATESMDAIAPPPQ